MKSKYVFLLNDKFKHRNLLHGLIIETSNFSQIDIEKIDSPSDLPNYKSFFIDRINNEIDIEKIFINNFQLLAKELNINFNQGTFITDNLELKEIKITEAIESKKIIYVPAPTIVKEISWAKKVSEFLINKKINSLKWETPYTPDFQSNLTNEDIKYINKTGNLKFYDKNNDQVKTAYQEATRKKKILLHICCGPDAAGVIGQLKEEFDLTCFWYDPNIQPIEEYDLRLNAFIKVAEITKTPYIIGEYDVQNFFSKIKGLEHTPEKGAKCTICYDMRLERSAIEAKEKEFDLFTTTLAISPHKVQKKLQNFGELCEKKHGVPYLARNFMKHEGFKKSVDFTKENNIYRQDYCGCYFSLYEGGQKARELAKELKVEKKDMQKPYTNPWLS